MFRFDRILLKLKLAGSSFSDLVVAGLSRGIRFEQLSNPGPTSKLEQSMVYP